MPCILCASAHQSLVAVKSGFELVRCEECGLVSVDPLPSEKEIADYYRQGYNQFRYSFSTPLADPPPGKLRELEIIEGHAQVGRLLDVGSAHGHFLENAHRHGWTVEGVEPQDEARELSSFRFRHPVHRSLAEARDGAFDVCTMWHVIEHLRSPGEFLAEVGRKLAPGGILAVTTPNMNSLVAKATGRSWGWLSPPDHLFLYSPTTLPRILAQQGFEVLHVETRRGQSRNFLLLMAQAAAFRLGFFDRLKNSVGRSAMHYQKARNGFSRITGLVLAERLTELLSKPLYPLLWLVYRAGLGDEVMAVARKRPGS